MIRSKAWRTTAAHTAAALLLAFRRAASPRRPTPPPSPRPRRRRRRRRRPRARLRRPPPSCRRRPRHLHSGGSSACCTSRLRLLLAVRALVNDRQLVAQLLAEVRWLGYVHLIDHVDGCIEVVPQPVIRRLVGDGGFSERGDLGRVLPNYDVGPAARPPAALLRALLRGLAGAARTTLLRRQGIQASEGFHLEREREKFAHGVPHNVLVRARFVERLLLFRLREIDCGVHAQHDDVERDERGALAAAERRLRWSPRRHVRHVTKSTSER